MIFLPNTPPMPTSLRVSQNVVENDFLNARIALNNAVLENQNQLIRYVVDLEEYIESIFSYIKRQNNLKGMHEASKFASNLRIMDSYEIPWCDLVQRKSQEKQNPESDMSRHYWSLSAEIEACIVSIALAYIRLGSEMANELIEIDTDMSTDINEKWQRTLNYFKKAISFIKFGELFRKNLNAEECRLSDTVYVFIKKIGFVCIQIATLSKSSWSNRLNYDKSEVFQSKNNGLLARVSVYVVDELRICKKLLQELQSVNTYATLNCRGWPTYFQIVEKYAIAYAGLFLSIENYQKRNLGYAIGLINFSLLTLQSKKFAEIKQQGKFIKALKTKILNKKNDHYINNLQSITTLNIDKSVFSDKNGIILKDLSLLFDQLILLHLKLSKENDNIEFQQVTNIQDIGVDSKWPLGSKIPVSDIKPFDPLGEQEDRTKEYYGKGAYY